MSGDSSPVGARSVASTASTDSGGFAVRGAIEGFYGRPYSWSERESLVDFLGARGMNTYVYAPKNDPLHRERWRDLYDAEACAAFARFASLSRRAGVRLFYAIAPGLSYDTADAEEFARLEAKLAQLLDLGVEGIALLFDDIAFDSAAVDPVLQAELVARTAESVARRAPNAAFWFIGNHYAGTAHELDAGEGTFASLYPHRARDYFAEYQRRVPAEIPILWTGPAVFSATLTLGETAAVRDLVGRPLIVWDNFPVNDALPWNLFLGPYVGRDARLPEAAHGVVVNLMSQASATRLPLATVAEYLRDPSGYDAERSWAAAIAEIGAGGAEALGILAGQLRGHPVLAAESGAPELARRVDAAFGGGGASARGLSDLAAYLETLAALDARLERSIADGALRAELTPWSAKLAALANAGSVGLRAIADRDAAEGFRALRRVAEARPEIVASTRLPEGLRPFVSGGGPGVDHFADLFDAIERELAQREPSTTVT